MVVLRFKFSVVTLPLQSSQRFGDLTFFLNFKKEIVNHNIFLCVPGVDKNYFVVPPVTTENFKKETVNQWSS